MRSATDARSNDSLLLQPSLASIAEHLPQPNSSLSLLVFSEVRLGVLTLVESCTLELAVKDVLLVRETSEKAESLGRLGGFLPMEQG